VNSWKQRQVASNDPFDRAAPIKWVIEQTIHGREYMQSIREFPVPADSFAVWFFGQNGFVLKDESSRLLGIDLYLSNSCAKTFADLPFRLDRQLPVFVEPEDLDVDVFVTTHSHDDHADPETISRLRRMDRMTFVGPFNSLDTYRKCGIPDHRCRLIHPGEALSFDTMTVGGTFALPTDASDLNHMGILVTFGNGLTFYNTGDTAWAAHLPTLLPSNVDVCAICINGGFHNLAAEQAAAIVKCVRPAVVIPCHYDMMINNLGSPDMFHVALKVIGSESRFVVLNYYEPWIYRRAERPRPR
jgi:L-ascorbate 6-phosphate lactonase